MNPVRKLVDDLIEKRLWPVALMLVVAAITLPIIIGGGGDAGSDTPDPTLTPAPAADGGATTAVELVGPPAVRSRAGAVRDPFRRKKVVDATAASAASTGAATAATSSGSATAAASKTGSAKKSSSSKSTKTTRKATPTVELPAIASRWAYQTIVRFTRPGGTRERPLARLAVLGKTSSPALQYLGVSSAGTHAIFALGPNATTKSSDSCMIAAPCRVIGLRRGEKVGVDVTGDDLVARHYELEVTQLRRLPMRTVAQARVWRARVDPAGREVLRAIKQDPATAEMLAVLRYRTATGTVGLVR
jgi:hypothetical protein